MLFCILQLTWEVSIYRSHCRCCVFTNACSVEYTRLICVAGNAFYVCVSVANLPTTQGIRQPGGIDIPSILPFEPLPAGVCCFVYSTKRQVRTIQGQGDQVFPRQTRNNVGYHYILWCQEFFLSIVFRLNYPDKVAIFVTSRGNSPAGARPFVTACSNYSIQFQDTAPLQSSY